MKSPADVNETVVNVVLQLLTARMALATEVDIDHSDFPDHGFSDYRQSLVRHQQTERKHKC